MKLLADTSALLALVLEKDENHRAAAAFVRANPKARFVSSDLILAEVATRLRARSSAERAVGITRDILRSRRYEVVFADPEILDAALDLMARLHDKRLSLTDCASFALMDSLGLDTAFTFDTDFRDCGYVTLP